MGPGLALPLLEAMHANRSVRLIDVATRLAKVQGIDLERLRSFVKQVGGQLPFALREVWASGVKLPQEVHQATRGSAPDNPSANWCYLAFRCPALLLSFLTPALDQTMNSTPRFKVIVRHGGDFLEWEKTWWVVDNETGKRVIGFSTNAMQTGCIATVELSPDGWEAVAKDADGEIIDRVDLKTRVDDPPQGFSRKRRGVRGALGSEEAPRGLPLNPYYDWKPEDYRRFAFAWKPERVRTQFNRARTGMIARLEERIAEAPPAERAQLEQGLEAVKRTRFEIDPSPDTFAERNGRTLRLSSGLIHEVVARVAAANVDEARSRALGRNVLVLILAGELAHISGIEAEDRAKAEGLEATEKAVGPIGDIDVRTAREILTRSGRTRRY